MFGEVIRIMEEMGYTHTEIQQPQGLPVKQSEKGKMRKNLLNRFKMRMLSALKGEQYR